MTMMTTQLHMTERVSHLRDHVVLRTQSRCHPSTPYSRFCYAWCVRCCHRLCIISSTTHCISFWFIFVACLLRQWLVSMHWAICCQSIRRWRHYMHCANYSSKCRYGIRANSVSWLRRSILDCSIQMVTAAMVVVILWQQRWRWWLYSTQTITIAVTITTASSKKWERLSPKK